MVTLSRIFNRKTRQLKLNTKLIQFCLCFGVKSQLVLEWKSQKDMEITYQELIDRLYGTFDFTKRPRLIFYICWVVEVQRFFSFQKSFFFLHFKKKFFFVFQKFFFKTVTNIFTVHNLSFVKCRVGYSQNNLRTSYDNYLAKHAIHRSEQVPML